MAWEYCTLEGAVSRATNLLDLTIEYRNVPGKTSETLTGLPRTELDSTVKALRGEGWELESQCANPTSEWYKETYSFRRPSQTAE
jgi:hypothetical protein